jgi:hypothetical protein
MIGVALQTKDRNPTSNLTLNPNPNHTLGVVEIMRLIQSLMEQSSSLEVFAWYQKYDVVTSLKNDMFPLLSDSCHPSCSKNNT